MFTGIVQAMGKLKALHKRDFGARLIIDRCGWRPDGGLVIRHGDSICISGVCLTVAAFDDDTLEFDVITETLRYTNLGGLEVGGAVNLEPSLTASTPMGGHFVQGHIDGVGEVTHVQEGEDWRIRIRPDAKLKPYIIPKGSVAIDGVSMTIASVLESGEFEVAVIPTTLRMTTLGLAKPGVRFNLESDIVTRTIVHTMREMNFNADG